MERGCRRSVTSVRHGPDRLIALVVFVAFPRGATNVQIRVRVPANITQAPLSRTVVGSPFRGYRSCEKLPSGFHRCSFLQSAIFEKVLPVAQP
jgi:hypothetical protein